MDDKAIDKIGDERDLSEEKLEVVKRIMPRLVEQCEYQSRK